MLSVPRGSPAKAMCGDAYNGAKKAGNGKICSTTKAISATGAARGRRMAVIGARKLAERKKTPSPRIITSVMRKKGGEVPPNASTAIHIAMLRATSAIRSTEILTADRRFISVAFEYIENPQSGIFHAIPRRKAGN